MVERRPLEPPMSVRFVPPEQLQQQRDGLLVSRLLRELESAGSTPATLTDIGTDREMVFNILQGPLTSVLETRGPSVTVGLRSLREVEKVSELPLVAHWLVQSLDKRPKWVQFPTRGL